VLQNNLSVIANDVTLVKKTIRTMVITGRITGAKRAAENRGLLP